MGDTYLLGVHTCPATSSPQSCPFPLAPVGVPDGHAGVMGRSAHHGGLGTLDDALVLGRPGDAGPGWETAGRKRGEKGHGLQSNR